MQIVDITAAKFKMMCGNGGLVITPGAADIVSPDQLFRITGEHYRLDDLSDAEDKQANLDSLKTGARIFTVHQVQDEKIWIITEASLDSDPLDRSNRPTTILLPSEY